MEGRHCDGMLEGKAGSESNLRVGVGFLHSTLLYFLLDSKLKGQVAEVLRAAFSKQHQSAWVAGAGALVTSRPNMRTDPSPRAGR